MRLKLFKFDMDYYYLYYRHVDLKNGKLHCHLTLMYNDEQQMCSMC